jgi:hypothetical protein
MLIAEFPQLEENILSDSPEIFETRHASRAVLCAFARL